MTATGYILYLDVSLSQVYFCERRAEKVTKNIMSHVLVYNNPRGEGVEEDNTMLGKTTSNSQVMDFCIFIIGRLEQNLESQKVVRRTYVVRKERL